MKRRFNKLSLIIDDLEKDYKVEVSSSSTGNFLECINLALDHYTSHFQVRLSYSLKKFMFLTHDFYPHELYVK